MKKVFLSALCVAILSLTEAQQLKTPSPSPTQITKQDFGLGNVEISYSRPGVKGRKIFGDLVPFDKVWRTGANGATTLTFTEEVMIGGTKLPAGKYGLLSIPSANEWTLIITKQLDVTSPAAYKQENDVVRVKAKPFTLNVPVERFNLSLLETSDSTAKLQLTWDKTGVDLPISSDVDSKVMQQIGNMMDKDNRPYYASALYYAEHGKDMDQAIKWFDKAIEQDANAFWIHYQKAKALSKQGKKAEAMTASVKSMALAREAKNDDYVSLNEKLQKGLK